jgi:hypothetical protein
MNQRSLYYVLYENLIYIEKVFLFLETIRIRNAEHYINLYSLVKSFMVTGTQKNIERASNTNMSGFYKYDVFIFIFGNQYLGLDDCCLK